jgi:hypothetical protein
MSKRSLDQAADQAAGVKTGGFPVGALPRLAEAIQVFALRDDEFVFQPACDL